jgi:shikimate dehydrogenase
MSWMPADQRSAVSGSTRLFCIIGDPVASVRSPQFFNALFAEWGIDAVFVAMHVQPAGLAHAIAGLRAIANLDGIVITMPHKQPALALVDEALPTARRVGAINTIRRDPGGRLVGDMFDGKGCLLGMLWNGVDPHGQRALIVGAGGAGSAIAFALAERGAAAITIADSDTNRAAELAGRVVGVFPACAARRGNPEPPGHDIVVNATPMGMQQTDALPIDPALLDPQMVVVDVVTNPDPTALVTAALARGCRAYSGRHMHEGQAVYAARFLGIPFMPKDRPEIALP